LSLRGTRAEAIPIPRLPRSARNDNKKGCNGTSFVIARHNVPKQSHALRGNPKLEALNPKQVQKSKIKNQNDKLKCKKPLSSKIPRP
jgi:hypothetical protein